MIRPLILALCLATPVLAQEITTNPLTDPASGIDPVSGLRILPDGTLDNPITIDPATGRSVRVDPATGLTVVIDPMTGQPARDPVTGDPILLTPEGAPLTELGVSEQTDAPEALSRGGAQLRFLDKVTGIVTDLEIANGTAERISTMAIAVYDCRVPADNPSGDAYALLRIDSDLVEGPVFQGWMIASAPALSAMDHPRYDLWVLGCSSS